MQRGRKSRNEYECGVFAVAKASHGLVIFLLSLLSAAGVYRHVTPCLAKLELS